MTNEATPGGLASTEGLGLPFAELHEPASEFEDGTWHKPLAQGWSGGTLVYTDDQVRALLTAERERWKASVRRVFKTAVENAEVSYLLSLSITDQGADVYVCTPG